MAKPLQKERENRSADKKDLTFHPYNITPESAHTAILLLEAKEPEIICQTLRAITKFAAQDMQNRVQLYNLEGIKYVLPHIDNPEINIKRFALKALAQLLQLPKGPEQVLENQQNLRKVAFALAKMEDVFVQEFASLVLAELTREPVGCEQLLGANILSSLFSRMKNSLDPDVQKNCLQTLYNMLSDPVCASEVTKNNQFNWPSLLALMQSPYLAIQQAAIKTVDQLICRYKDQAVQKSFRASTGVLDLCDILESYEFRDTHADVLRVLRNYVETEENAAHVYQSGCILRLLAYLEMAMPSMKPPCLSVLTKMSFTQNGRQALFDTGTDLVFCHQLLGTNAECLADAAMGVANMTKLLPSAIRMCDTNIIEALGSILGDEQAPWFFVRINALKALVELCRLIPKAAFGTVEPKNFGALKNINKKYKDNPIEAQRLAVQCFSSLLNYHESTKAMLSADFIQDLLNIMMRPDILLKIMTADLLVGLMAENICKDIFTSRKGEMVVSENLQIEHIGLRTALCLLIAASVTDEGANSYLELGTIHFMVNNRNARYVVSAWEAALEAIFRHHPSAKFGYYGRLDINDFTFEGFYVLKHLTEVFPPLHEVANRPPPHRDPVFACFFFPPETDKRVSNYDIRTPYPTSKSLLALHPASTASRLRLPDMPDDAELRDYVVKLKIWFGDPAKSLQYIEIEDAHYDVRYRDKCAEVSTSLKQKAQMMGEFVAEQMSGLSQERDCSMPSVDLHLADLMRELHSPVVGLGWVRCGGALERAILYKVLADRVGLPCALYRAPSAHAWVEIALPEPDEEELETPSKYPAGLLRANYVVDLMYRPGRLAPIGSYEAQRITGGQSERYVARKITPICKCPKMNAYYCKSEKEIEDCESNNTC